MSNYENQLVNHLCFRMQESLDGDDVVLSDDDHDINDHEGDHDTMYHDKIDHEKIDHDKEQSSPRNETVSVPALHVKCKAECLAMSAVTMRSKGVEFLSQHASTWDHIWISRLFLF